jgi:DinB superfamily
MRFHLERSVDVLRRTPGTLIGLVNGLDDTWTRATEGAETFSAFDVIGHLIDGEETDWVPRARLILDRSTTPFEPYDRFRHRGRNAQRSVGSLVEEFGRLRADNLKVLDSWRLSEADLDLSGTHPGLGRVTLRQLLAAWVVHDLGHIAQIARVMAKQYREEIGPWAQYLPVVTDRPTPRS